MGSVSRGCVPPLASPPPQTVGLAHQVLADRIAIHATKQAPASPPSTFHAPSPWPYPSAQISLVFTDDERGPTDPGLRLHLEAVNHLDPDEQNAIRTLIEGTLLRHQARRLAAS